MIGLSDAEHDAITRARRALAETLQREVPPEQLLPLIISATVAGFVDIVTAASETPALVAFVNSELAGAGWRWCGCARRVINFLAGIIKRAAADTAISGVGVV
jgi:hypothetical protein